MGMNGMYVAVAYVVRSNSWSMRTFLETLF